MALKSLKVLHMTLTVGTVDHAINFLGNLENYPSALDTPCGFANPIAEADEAAMILTLGIITPIEALLKSGSFRKLAISSTAAKKRRTIIVPTDKVAAVESFIKGTGITIAGNLYKNVSNGLRRRVV